MVPEKGESHLFHTLSLLHIFFKDYIYNKGRMRERKKKKKGHNEGWTSKWKMIIIFRKITEVNLEIDVFLCCFLATFRGYTQYLNACFNFNGDYFDKNIKQSMYSHTELKLKFNMCKYNDTSKHLAVIPMVTIVSVVCFQKRLRSFLYQKLF